MYDINGLVAELENDLRDAEQREAEARLQGKSVLENVRLRGSGSLTADETQRFDSLRKRGEDARRDVTSLRSKLENAKAIQAEERESDRLSQITRPTNAARPNRTATFSVSRNERTYRPDNDPHGQQFLMDVARGSIFGDVQANDRLLQHSAEERVERPGYSERAAGDLLTGGLGGLVVPQYLVELYAPAIAAMRPFADLCTPHILPQSGMSLIVPKITTASSAALQTTQLTGVSATSVVETDLTLTVQTAAGQQNVSRQAVERGTGIDEMVTRDLFKRVATLVDSTLINAASTGITNTAAVTTYTSAAPTGVEAYPYIFQASSKLEQALLAQAPVNTVVMHPRRWNWFASQVASSWPLMGSMNQGVAPQMTMVQVTNEYGPSVRGVLTNGLRVCVDANVPVNLGAGTNQDEIYLVASDEIHIWEQPDQPLLIRAEQPNAANLGILLVVYEYFAFTAQRYANNPGKISGTGLVAPAGF
jgi:hypothetical protein